MNKKEDKFQFVTMDDINTNEDVVNVDHIEVVDDIPETISVSNNSNDSSNIIDDTNAIKVEKDPNSKPDKEYSINKFYFGYKGRIVTTIVIIFCLLSIAGVLIVKTLNSSKTEYIEYDEFSTSTYRICDISGIKCLEGDNFYNSNDIGDVEVNFNYSVNYSSKYKYDYNYHISAITNIYDKKDTSKTLYRGEEILLDNLNARGNEKSLDISKKVLVDYVKNNEIAVNYKDIYKGEYEANIEIALYLDNEDETGRKISSVIVPLNKTEFKVEEHNLNNRNEKLEVKTITWNEYNTLSAVIASTLILVSLLLIYRTTQFVLKTTGSNYSEYEQKVLKILREYDNIIVVARDGYESNISKEVFKVDSFDKLLDIKRNLSKPIIYSKLNSSKCEFIVDDDNILYKFVMLEDE